MKRRHFLTVILAVLSLQSNVFKNKSPAITILKKFSNRYTIYIAWNKGQRTDSEILTRTDIASHKCPQRCSEQPLNPYLLPQDRWKGPVPCPGQAHEVRFPYLGPVKPQDIYTSCPGLYNSLEPALWCWRYPLFLASTQDVPHMSVSLINSINCLIGVVSLYSSSFPTHCSQR